MTDPLISYILVWIVGGVILALWAIVVVKWSNRREDRLRRGQR